MKACCPFGKTMGTHNLPAFLFVAPISISLPAFRVAIDIAFASMLL
jgi:hypothetical protein